jgi:hypothetical protein
MCGRFCPAPLGGHPEIEELSFRQNDRKPVSGDPHNLGARDRQLNGVQLHHLQLLCANLGQRTYLEVHAAALARRQQHLARCRQ